MKKTVLGVFSSQEDAQSAIDDLQDAGYEARDISIIMKNKERAEEFAASNGNTVANGAVSGAVTGGVIGGIAGLLLGVGAIAVPGIGALLIGGPIAAALGATGAAATTVSGATTGILAGGFIGALMGLGIPNEDAAIYEERIRSGGILVAIPSQLGHEEDVMAILEDNAADQIRTIDSSITPEHEEEDAYRDSSPYPYAHLGAKGGKSRAHPRSQKTRQKNK